MSMNPDVRRTWVAALRSGEYAQASGKLTRLREDGSRAHCCLGVLCELAVEAGVLAPGVDAGLRVVEYGARGAFNYLPAEVVTWAQLDDANPTVGVPLIHVDGRYTRTLSALNDQGTSFADIADLIEEQL